MSLSCNGSFSPGVSVARSAIRREQLLAPALFRDRFSDLVKTEGGGHRGRDHAAGDGRVAVRLDPDSFRGSSLDRRGYRIASATSCSSLRLTMAATSVTFAFPNCSNSEDGLSYSTQVFPLSSS